jgi:hypothetical protein
MRPSMLSFISFCDLFNQNLIHIILTFIDASLLFSGINSLQMLSWLASVINNNGDPNGYYQDAYLLLTNATNQVQ